MLSSSLHTSSMTSDERALRTYLRGSTAWNLDESAPGPPMDHYNLSSSGNADKFLNSSVNFPAEMRSANLNEMVSNIIDENGEYHLNGSMPSHGINHMMMQTGWSNHPRLVEHSSSQYSAMKTMPPRQTKGTSSSFAENGQPRNIPDSCSTCPNPPKDIQVLIRKFDHHGVNAVVITVPLQEFRQMIGLQSSATNANNDRRFSSSQRSTDSRRVAAYPSVANSNPPISSSSSSSSSSQANANLLLINSSYKSNDNKNWPQDTILSSQNYTTMPNNDRQHSPMLPISTHDLNYSTNNSSSSIVNENNLLSPITSCQDISYYRSNRRTGVANTLHISIEKCYEQLNYIRDSYAETEAKIGIQVPNKCASPSIINDGIHGNISTLSNNPSRVDRLIAEYYHEYHRMIRLHDRVKEHLTSQDTEATRQTLDEWLSAINIVQDRRRQEIENAAEKCRSGEPRLPDEKDVLQLAEALRILRITTRKIRTVLWYWLYWSTNVTSNRIPLVVRHQDEQLTVDSNLFYSTLIGDCSKQTDIPTTMSFLYSSSLTNHEESLFSELDEHGQPFSKKKSITSNENNKENECNE